MAVAAQIRRSCTVAAATLMIGALLDVMYVVALCPNGRLASRVARHEAVVIDSGYRFAVPGEIIVTCTTPHRGGPFTFHDDFACYCVPADTNMSELGSRLGGECTVDKRAPRRTDTDGICRHAHCDDPE